MPFDAPNKSDVKEDFKQHSLRIPPPWDVEMRDLCAYFGYEALADFLRDLVRQGLDRAHEERKSREKGGKKR
jgi:hypothetical protein